MGVGEKPRRNGSARHPLSAREDLAYLRSVTEQARSAPLLGGRFLVMWGILLSGAYACHWAIMSGVVGLPWAL